MRIYAWSRYTDEREDQNRRRIPRQLIEIGRVGCMRPREEGWVCDRIYAEFDTSTWGYRKTTGTMEMRSREVRGAEKALVFWHEGVFDLSSSVPGDVQ